MKWSGRTSFRHPNLLRHHVNGNRVDRLCAGTVITVTGSLRNTGSHTLKIRVVPAGNYLCSPVAKNLKSTTEMCPGQGEPEEREASDKIVK